MDSANRVNLKAAKPPRSQRVQCGSPKRLGGICQAWAIKGRKRCRIHGGKGEGRPPTTYRYSALAGPIGDAYRASIADANLLDPREPLAGLDAIVKMQTARMEAGDSPKFRSVALELLSQALTARSGGDGATEDALLKALAKHLTDGNAATDAEAELSRRLQTFARHNEEANRQRLAKAANVNAQFLVKLFAALAGDLAAKFSREIADGVLDVLQSRIDGGDPGGPLAIELAVSRGAGADLALTSRN